MTDPTQDLLDEIYAFIRAYIAQYGFSPSIRDVARACFLSVATASRYLDKLEARGRITRSPGQARSIRLVEETEKEK